LRQNQLLPGREKQKKPPCKKFKIFSRHSYKKPYNGRSEQGVFMKPSLVDDLLLLFFWTAEKMARPTLCHLLESFEEWEYRTRIGHRLRYLERRSLIERRNQAGQPLFGLTAAGRSFAIGACDPEIRWNRPWDGQWRFVSYDLPARQSKLRKRLWSWLLDNRIGHLQGSLWITPDPLDAALERLPLIGRDPRSFIRLTAGHPSESSDPELVSTAWNFEEINHHYMAYLESVTDSLEKLIASRDPQLFPPWMRNERLLWHTAITADPLLPAKLLPPGYLGRMAWQVRARAKKQISSYLAHLAHLARPAKSSHSNA
jgi:DNA-binding transcriptional regulator PaaX